MNSFSNCGPKLTSEDLNALERNVHNVLPAGFRKHYLIWNGGNPELDWVPGTSNWEPIWIQEFLSVGNSDKGDRLTIQKAYALATSREILTTNSLPFAIDPGANYFCLNLENGAISYHVNDMWDKHLTSEANRTNATRIIASSFSEFLESLTSEDDALT